MGKEVVVAESGQRRLYRIRAFSIHLLQRYRRNSHLSLGYIAKIGIEGHLLSDLSDQKIRIQSAEGLTYVGLFSESHEARQQFSYASVIYVAVFVSGAVISRIVGVYAGYIFKSFLLLELHQFVEGGDNSL